MGLEGAAYAYTCVQASGPSVLVHIFLVSFAEIIYSAATAFFLLPPAFFALYNKGHHRPHVREMSGHLCKE